MFKMQAAASGRLGAGLAPTHVTKESPPMFTPPPSNRATVLGATRPGFQPGDSWVVLTDPEGHAFCLVADD